MRSRMVSVVMPAYNQEPWITEAIESVLTQSHVNLELIVVDDGSTDGTADKVAAFGDRVRYVHRPNGGAAAARNTGVTHARGEFLAFCDADDVQARERLEVQLAILESMPDVAFVASDFFELSGNVKRGRALHRRWLGPMEGPFAEELVRAFGPGQMATDLELPVRPEHLRAHIYRGIVPELFAAAHFAWVGAMLVRRAAFHAVGGFDPELTHYEDWDLGSRIAKTRPVAFADLELFEYRSHPNQLTKQTLDVTRAYLTVAEKVFCTDCGMCRKHGRTIDRTLGSAHWQLGRLAADRGDWAGAERCFLRSLGANPRQRRAYVDYLHALAMKHVERALH